MAIRPPATCSITTILYTIKFTITPLPAECGHRGADSGCRDLHLQNRTVVTHASRRAGPRGSACAQHGRRPRRGRCRCFSGAARRRGSVRHETCVRPPGAAIGRSVSAPSLFVPVSPARATTGRKRRRPLRVRPRRTASEFRVGRFTLRIDRLHAPPRATMSTQVRGEVARGRFASDLRCKPARKEAQTKMAAGLVLHLVHNNAY